MSRPSLDPVSPVIARFIAPRHAACDVDIGPWQSEAEADTPGADATCRLCLRLDRAGGLEAAFAAHGPPVVIAAADWLCENLRGRSLDEAREITPRDIEQALMLPAVARYACLLVVETLAKALSNLGSCDL